MSADLVSGAVEPSGLPVPCLRLLVVDHRQAFSEALTVRLALEPDVVVAATAGSFEAAEALLDELEPTVGVVALDLVGGGGLVLVTAARRSHPAVRWVVMGSDGAPLDVADAIVAGASGYVTMDSPAAVLALALRAAVAGFSLTPEDLLRSALVELDRPGAAANDLQPQPEVPPTTSCGGLADSRLS